MKLNKKIIVPALAIAAFAALGVGSTYAIFTSSAETNIAVTAGKISITASVENLKLYSGVYNESTGAYDSVEQTSSFLNGGTATAASGVVTLDKITPMDKVEFDVKVTNDSNVAAKYRTSLETIADDGLLAGLNITFGGKSYTGGTTYGDWTAVDPTVTDIDTIHVVAELPETAGNDYQGKSCSIKFGVSAVQGNAHTVNTITVVDQSGLNDAVANADENTEIKVASSSTVYTIPTVTNKTVKIVGSDADGVKFDRGSGQVTCAGSTLSFENVTMVGGSNNYTGIIHSAAESYTNCKFTGRTTFYATTVTVKNCTFTQTSYDYCFWTYGSQMSFEDCTFDTAGKAVKVYTEDSDSTKTFKESFKNCTFNSSDSSKNKPAIAVNTLGLCYDITIDNCTLNGFNCTDDAMTEWYTTRMASASDTEKSLIGCEGTIANIKVTIDGTEY